MWLFSLLQNWPNRLRASNSPLFNGLRNYLPRVKRQGRETEHWHPSSAEVKNEGSYTSATPICLHDVETSVTKYVSFKVLGPAKI
jgi:hypothetical protein